MWIPQRVGIGEWKAGEKNKVSSHWHRDLTKATMTLNVAPKDWRAESPAKRESLSVVVWSASTRKYSFCVGITAEWQN